MLTHPATCHLRTLSFFFLSEDLISAVQFDNTGDYLATGDRGGRVVIFESSEVTQRQAQRENGDADMYHPPSRQPDIEYRFYCEFQSHEPEFDYLKSLEIEEKIESLRLKMKGNMQELQEAVSYLKNEEGD